MTLNSSAPSSLKLIESLLAQSPQHKGLLLAAARGFTQYAYAFAQQDAEEAEARQALRIDTADAAQNRLANLIAQRRARWLLSRADHLFTN